MNQPLPTWWLVLSAIFFVTTIVALGAVAYLSLTVVKLVRDVRPKVDEIGKKVGVLSEKVEGIAANVQDLTESVKGTVTNVGARASHVAGSVELVANSASRQFERFAPFITGALTAIRLAKALNEMRAGRSPVAATTNQALEKRPATPVPSRKKFLGLL